MTGLSIKICKRVICTVIAAAEGNQNPWLENERWVHNKKCLAQQYFGGQFCYEKPAYLQGFSINQ